MKDSISSRKRLLISLTSLLFISAFVRLLIVLVSTVPLTQPDSSGYLQLGEQIARLDLSQDNGARTPVYPLFLIAVGFDPSKILLAQYTMGLLITGMLFGIAWQLTKKSQLSWLVGAAYGLNLSQIRWETFVLSETLTTFLITSGVMSWLIARQQTPKSGWWLLSMGVFGALAGSTRPLFIFLPIILAGLAWMGLPKVNRTWLIASLVPVVILVGGWSFFNYLRFGYLGPTTLTGLELTNISGGFIEYAPDRYAVIRDVYLDARQAALSKGGSYRCLVLHLTDGLMQATGKSYAQLSQEYGRLSMDLFVSHPTLYAQNLVRSWIDFWNEPGWWEWEGTYNPGVARALGYAWRLEKYVLVCVNFLFLLLTATIVLAILLKRWQWGDNARWSTLSMITIVLVPSLMQALVESPGEGGRYALPVSPFVVCVVVSAISHMPRDWWETILRRKPTPA